MAGLKTWFVIINPTSGNGSGKKKWAKIKRLLNTYGFDFDYAFTEYKNHSNQIVKSVIKKGYKNIISVGGDGTLHNIVNGIMQQNKISTKSITIGVIPIGTGNDWAKTHHIPKNLESAIQIIKKGKIKIQDIGKIEYKNENRKPVYFMNLAGIGFDGYVVSRVKEYKRLGSLAYLFGALAGLMSFKKFQSKVHLNTKQISGKTLMILIGLCKYSGGGMQLTKTPNPFDGLFDISIVKNLKKFDVIKNITKLFNGKIVNNKYVESHKCNTITIEIFEENLPYIQADGELIGSGNISVTIIPLAFSFYCKKKSAN
ncbi:MAG: diacylglycerol kinase family lipid kinase [Bacteroidetes bacterium]|nr:MAG: diacylglycerol kinase family lipid kinase [Bacteroidota bacterium]